LVEPRTRLCRRYDGDTLRYLAASLSFSGALSLVAIYSAPLRWKMARHHAHECAAVFELQEGQLKLNAASLLQCVSDLLLSASYSAKDVKPNCPQLLSGISGINNTQIDGPLFLMVPSV
jgi:hypothetical protein